MPLDGILVMALALGGGGLVKGATGMGLPLVALPMASVAKCTVCGATRPAAW